MPILLFFIEDSTSLGIFQLTYELTYPLELSKNFQEKAEKISIAAFFHPADFYKVPVYANPRKPA